MLTNNGLCLSTAVHHVLLFLVGFNNFKFYGVHALLLATCSYAFLCALGYHPICETEAKLC